MWGLDQAAAEVAIPAMQAMNASVRNAIFLPAFFLTPVTLGVTALAAWRAERGAGRAFGAAAALYLVGGLGRTLAVNVPMNAALAARALPDNPAEAAAAWAPYSPRWQAWNAVRTLACAAGLLLAGPGTWRAARATALA